MSEKKDSRADRMLTEPLPKVITQMALPSIVSFIITTVYNLADTFFVSFLGESATAAVSVNASLDQFIMMAGSMLAVGAASYVSRLLGAGEKKKADQALSTAFFLAALFGGVIMILGLMFQIPAFGGDGHLRAVFRAIRPIRPFGGPADGGKFCNEPVPPGGRERNAFHDRHGVRRDLELRAGSDLYLQARHGGRGGVCGDGDL